MSGSRRDRLDCKDSGMWEVPQVPKSKKWGVPPLQGSSR